MLSKEKIKHINSLKNKKFRNSELLFIVEGIKVVDSLFESPYEIVELFAVLPYIELREGILASKNIKPIIITEKELQRISLLSTPNQVFAVCKMKENHIHINSLRNTWSFVLDGINDPGNLGTIIRIAHWFSIKNIICSNDTVDVYNPKTVQATMGSFAYINVFYTELPTFISKIKNDFSVAGTFTSGKNIHDASFDKQGLMVLGSESHGISKEIAALTDIKLSIPFANNMFRPDSLNVSVSAGIIASELLRNNVLN